MVLVNNPGTWQAIYPPLRHADWHGWTPTDVIFPFFVFIVGVAIPLALGPRLESGERSALVVKVLRRSIVIFGLGIILNGFPWYHWATLRIPGVLQRIAVCYLLAAIVYLFTSTRVQAVITAALLLGYWLVMSVVPVPGYGAGDLSPAGNLAAYIDRGGPRPAHLAIREGLRPRGNPEHAPRDRDGAPRCPHRKLAPQWTRFRRGRRTARHRRHRGHRRGRALGIRGFRSTNPCGRARTWCSPPASP